MKTRAQLFFEEATRLTYKPLGFHVETNEKQGWVKFSEDVLVLIPVATHPYGEYRVMERIGRALRISEPKGFNWALCSVDEAMEREEKRAKRRARKR